MSMTEEDARKKWCPFVRVTEEGVEKSWNRSIDQFLIDGGKMKAVHTACIASECMAWRWVLTEKPGRHVPLGVKERVQGYCGLAGSPIEIRDF